MGNHKEGEKLLWTFLFKNLKSCRDLNRHIGVLWSLRGPIRYIIMIRLINVFFEDDGGWIVDQWPLQREVTTRRRGPGYKGKV